MASAGVSPSHSLIQCQYSLLPTTWRARLSIHTKTPSCPSLPILKCTPLTVVAGVGKAKEKSDSSTLSERPDDLDDEEWQARQREKTKEWHAYRKKEEEEENRKLDEYREIGMRLKGYSEEEVRKARILVASFIRSAEEVEEKIEEAAEKGELTELVLLVIWNRLDVARKDDEKDAIRTLDLLYRRIETEILKRESSPSMRLLNELLNLHDGYDDEGWLKKCKKCMVEAFPREDPFTILVPTGLDMESHHGRIKPPEDEDDVLLRIDFIKEVDSLLQEVRAESSEQKPEGLDPEAVAMRLKQQEKQRTIYQVEQLLELAVNLQW